MTSKEKNVSHPRQPSLRDVMNLLNSINARLTIQEQRVQHLMAEEKVERETKLPNPALTRATTGSSRDLTSKPTSVSPGQDTHLPQPAPRKVFRPPRQDPQLARPGPRKALRAGNMAEREKR